MSTTSNISDFQFGTGDFTIEAYILKTADGNDSYDGLCILGPGVGSGGDGYYFEVSSNRGIYFIIDGTSVSSNTWTNDGKWHHVAATRSSGTLYLFIDGVLQLQVQFQGLFQRMELNLILVGNIMEQLNIILMVIFKTSVYIKEWQNTPVIL